MSKPRSKRIVVTAPPEAAVATAAPPPFSLPTTSRGTVLAEAFVSARGVYLHLHEGQMLEGVDPILRQLLNRADANIRWDDIHA